jgi:hypothetical protein
VHAHSQKNGKSNNLNTLESNKTKGFKLDSQSLAMTTYERGD